MGPCKCMLPLFLLKSKLYNRGDIMIYLGNLTKINEIKNGIGFIHYTPFDEVNGLGKTSEELGASGILVDCIPEPKPPINKQVDGIYVNPQTKEVFYEYTDKPLTQAEEIVNLKSQIGSIGQSLSQEKIKNMQKDSTISNLGQELSKAKLDIIKLQGGTK